MTKTPIGFLELDIKFFLSINTTPEESENEVNIIVDTQIYQLSKSDWIEIKNLIRQIKLNKLIH